MTDGIQEISATELKARQDRGDKLFILDVREPHEYQIVNIGAPLIPLGDLPNRLGELDANREIVKRALEELSTVTRRS